MKDEMIEESTERAIPVRKRPVQVEAMHWDGSYSSAMAILGWIPAGLSELKEGAGRTYLAIHTREGVMEASVGDWIIKGVKGEFYPCNPDIFAETYDIADGDGVYALEEAEQGDFRAIQRAVHKTAVEHGWWEGLEETQHLSDRQIAEIGTVKVALMHSELSEALEELRCGRYALWTDEGKPEGMSVELADAVIRIMDLCEFLGIDLLAALRVKAAYNETRPYRHGNKAV